MLAFGKPKYWVPLKPCFDGSLLLGPKILFRIRENPSSREMADEKSKSMRIQFGGACILERILPVFFHHMNPDLQNHD